MSEAAQPPAKRRRVTFGDTETRTYAPARSSTDPRRPRADDAEDVHRARGGRRGGAQRAAAVAAAGSGSAEGDEYDESVVALVLMRVVQDVEIQADDSSATGTLPWAPSTPGFNQIIYDMTVDMTVTLGPPDCRYEGRSGDASIRYSDNSLNMGACG